MLSTVLADDITWSTSQSHTKASIIERMFYSYQFTKAFSYQRPNPASSTSCLPCPCFSQSSSCKQTPWRRRLDSPQPRSPERLTHHFLLTGVTLESLQLSVSLGNVSVCCLMDAEACHSYQHVLAWAGRDSEGTPWVTLTGVLALLAPGTDHAPSDHTELLPALPRPHHPQRHVLEAGGQGTLAPCVAPTCKESSPVPPPSLSISP